MRVILMLLALALAACGGHAAPHDDAAFRITLDGWVKCADDATEQRVEQDTRRSVICTWPCAHFSQFPGDAVVMAFSCQKGADGTWSEWEITDFGAAGANPAYCSAK